MNTPNTMSWIQPDAQPNLSDDEILARMIADWPAEYERLDRQLEVAEEHVLRLRAALESIRDHEEPAAQKMREIARTALE